MAVIDNQGGAWRDSQSGFASTVPSEATETGANFDPHTIANALTEQLAAANRRVQDARARRAQLLARAPQTDRVCDAMRAGLEQVARRFEADLAGFVTRPTEDGAAAILGADAAIYFMREHIAARLPATVARLFPDTVRAASPEVAKRELREASDAVHAAMTERLELRSKIVQERMRLLQAKSEQRIRNIRPNAIADADHRRDDLNKLLDELRIDNERGMGDTPAPARP
ncbi:hypothetical protein [Sphingomonas bacterium]|uniref:hypothetical protein n=1 Tax=Sphingomonas bacterium TaxID=1895847 RepID=UPI00157752C8|nr:hypothetical protein [Sphingomonas bacterium]